MGIFGKLFKTKEPLQGYRVVLDGKDVIVIGKPALITFITNLIDNGTDNVYIDQFPNLQMNITKVDLYAEPRQSSTEHY